MTRPEPASGRRWGVGHSSHLLRDGCRGVMRPKAEPAFQVGGGMYRGGDRMNDRALLQAEEVAKLLGIGRSKAYEMMAHGELPALRIGRLVRVPRHALDRAAHGGRVPRAGGSGAAARRDPRKRVRAADPRGPVRRPAAERIPGAAVGRPGRDDRRAARDADREAGQERPAHAVGGRGGRELRVRHHQDAPVNAACRDPEGAGRATPGVEGGAGRGTASARPGVARPGPDLHGTRPGGRSTSAGCVCSSTPRWTGRGYGGGSCTACGTPWPASCCCGASRRRWSRPGWATRTRRSCCGRTAT